MPAFDLRTEAARAIEQAVSEHIAGEWRIAGCSDRADRASHPCAVLHGTGRLDVFAKFGGAEQVAAELAGLALIGSTDGVRAPNPVGEGIVHVDGGAWLLLEAVVELDQASRTPDDWRAAGRTLARLHHRTRDRFGGDFDGYFGPLPQSNRPVGSNRWPDYFVERHLRERFDAACAAGHLPLDLARSIERLIERLIDRLDHLCGPEIRPSLVHGDAQQNNLLLTTTGVVLVDAAPYFGNPEVDLALVDYFAPVPRSLMDGYRELRSIDEGFAERRELWRLPAYLAIIAVDGAGTFGRSFIARAANAVAGYE